MIFVFLVCVIVSIKYEIKKIERNLWKLEKLNFIIKKKNMGL